MICRLDPIELIPGDGLPLRFDLKDDDDPQAPVFDNGDTVKIIFTAYDRTWEVAGTIGENNSVSALVPPSATEEIGDSRVKDVHFCLHIYPQAGPRRTVTFGEDKERGIEGQAWYPVRVLRCHPDQ
ncbi:MAG: hypothetical protein IJK23_12275 [Clostridia bacterium]|nr:hypothetical protein [Clostridia bacterium]